MRLRPYSAVLVRAHISVVCPLSLAALLGLASACWSRSLATQQIKLPRHRRRPWLPSKFRPGLISSFGQWAVPCAVLYELDRGGRTWGQAQVVQAQLSSLDNEAAGRLLGETANQGIASSQNGAHRWMSLWNKRRKNGFETAIEGPSPYPHD